MYITVITHQKMNLRYIQNTNLLADISLTKTVILPSQMFPTAASMLLLLLLWIIGWFRFPKVTITQTT